MHANIFQILPKACGWWKGISLKVVFDGNSEIELVRWKLIGFLIWCIHKLKESVYLQKYSYSHIHCKISSDNTVNFRKCKLIFQPCLVTTIRVFPPLAQSSLYSSLSKHKRISTSNLLFPLSIPILSQLPNCVPLALERMIGFLLWFCWDSLQLITNYLSPRAGLSNLHRHGSIRWCIRTPPPIC